MFLECFLCAWHGLGWGAWGLGEHLKPEKKPSWGGEKPR